MAQSHEFWFYSYGNKQDGLVPSSLHRTHYMKPFEETIGSQILVEFQRSSQQTLILNPKNFTSDVILLLQRLGLPISKSILFPPKDRTSHTQSEDVSLILRLASLHVLYQISDRHDATIESIVTGPEPSVLIQIMRQNCGQIVFPSKLVTYLPHIHSVHQNSDLTRNIRERERELLLQLSQDIVDDPLELSSVCLRHFIHRWPVIIPQLPDGVVLEEPDDQKLAELIGVDIRLLNPTAPTAFIELGEPVDWISWPGRYKITPHNKSTYRCFLLHISSGTYLINGNYWFRTNISSDVPFGTLFDGEMVEIVSEQGKRIVSNFANTPELTCCFLVSDLLCVSEERIWTRKFLERQEMLHALLSSVRYTSWTELRLVANTHFELGSEFPTQETCSADGVLFTPTDSYKFGQSPFYLKWQPIGKETVNFTNLMIEPENYFRRGDLELDIFGSKPPVLDEFARICNPDFQTKKYLSTKHYNTSTGKTRIGFPQDTQIPEIINAKYSLHELASKYAQCRQYNDSLIDKFVASTNLNLDSFVRQLPHPVLSFDFDTLLNRLEETTTKGYVTKTVDPETGLVIYNYLASAPPDDPIVMIARGLIIDVAAKKIVTMPFPRFFCPEPIQIASCADELVEATEKLDGTFVMVVKWNNRY